MYLCEGVFNGNAQFFFVVVMGNGFLFVPTTCLPAITRSRGGVEKVVASAYVFGEV
jgi:hypothetical protein